MKVSVTLLTVLTLLEVHSTLGVKPFFLWGVINETIKERRFPTHCTKLIFHNNSTLADDDVARNFSGLDRNSFIDVHATFSGGYVAPEDFPSDWDAAEQSLEAAHKVMIEDDKADPCLTVASFVFNAVQYDVHLENATWRRAFRHRLADLLQFSVPIRSRHLFLLRISEPEYVSCPKGPKFPTRLVPQWELLLFDFFHDAWVIQGPFHEDDQPFLHISRETGKWRWICDDILEKLELEKSCGSNQTCLIEGGVADLWNPLGPVPSSFPCKSRYRARQ